MRSFSNRRKQNPKYLRGAGAADDPMSADSAIDFSIFSTKLKTDPCIPSNLGANLVSFIKIGRYSQSMAAKKDETGSLRASSNFSGRVPVKKDISGIESETIARAGKTIQAIDNYLSKVQVAQSGRSIPKDLFPEIVRMRHFRDMLDSWRRDAISAHGRENEPERRSRLQEFIIICNTFSGV